MENTISLKKISSALNIPYNVLEWRISQDKAIVQNQHYEKTEKSININLLGFIVLISGNITTEYEKIAELLREFIVPKQDVSFLLTLKSLIDGKLSMTEEIPTEELPEEEEFEEEEEDSIEVPKRKMDKNKYTSDNVPALTDEKAIRWSTNIRSNMQAYVKEENEKGGNLTFSLLLRKLYRMARDLYGVDFDEAKKQFCVAYKIPANVKVSNFRLMSDTPAGRCIFEEIANRYMSENPL